MSIWIKILAVVLITYSLIAGMLIPLGPGVISSTPLNGNSGTTIQFDIHTYNTQYTNSEPKVYFKGESDKLLIASKVKVINDVSLEVIFDFPVISPGSPGIQDLTLVVNNTRNGNAILPGAMFLKVDQVSETAKGWSNLDNINFTIPKFTKFPYRTILEETIRNIYFHVSLWFAMLLVLLLAMVKSIQYLQKGEIKFDDQAKSYSEVGILFGILGLVTGMLWANYTWGAPWSFDVKQNMSAVALLIYLAYFVLRSSIDDQDKKYRVAAAYNIFAFIALIPLLFVIPRLAAVDSLHPGNGGNPALGSDDLDNTMRMVFWPAVLGWMLMGLWLSNILYRYHRAHRRFLER